MNELKFEVVEEGGSSSQLVLYDNMRSAVAQCAHIDEAKEIRDKATALQHYAKQRDDPELDRWMSEIRLRAIAQIGKLSRELEKGKPGPSPKITATGGGYLSKKDQLDAAGLKETYSRTLRAARFAIRASGPGRRGCHGQLFRHGRQRREAADLRRPR